MSETSSKQEWQAALRAHFTQECSDHALPARATFSQKEEFQCRILGGALLGWLKEYGPRLLQEREVLRESFEVESDPVVVIISSTPGLVAAREILGLRREMIFWFTAEAFAAFLERHPDPGNRWHVVYTTYFLDSIGEDDLLRASANDLEPNEEFWMHREHSLIAPLFERGGDHLWKWDGTDTTLLEEGFNMWLS